MTDAAKSGCTRIERVAEFALRALPADERSAFATHVDECHECSAELAALRPVVESFVEWPTNVLRPATPLWGRLAERIGVDAGEPEARWADEPAWKSVAPGITVKMLSTDEARGLVSMLVRLEPGISYPPHTHADIEELHLIEGELWIDDRLLHPGDYNRADAGSADARVYSETGCTCVLVTSFRDVLR